MDGLSFKVSASSKVFSPSYSAQPPQIKIMCFNCPSVDVSLPETSGLDGCLPNVSGES